MKIVNRMRITDAYQRIFEMTNQNIIGYVHDDVICHEHDWDARVLRQFADPSVGLVGLGGALQHGADDIYRSPYSLPQVGRSGFLSNMREAEVHGKRFESECNVAVVDGFALFVRREVLAKAGGWPINSVVDYFAYDYWISCITRRLGYKIRLVGVQCDHLGGKSTGLNQNLQADFEGAHRYIYDEFKDVLPCQVQP
jgi:Glycosyltransferase like family